MGKIVITILILVILGLYFFTDQTKNAINKITGYIVNDGKEKIKDVVKEEIKNLNTTDIKENIKEIVEEIK
ncbi:hypothetical protein HY498_01430 [Candidatus Woesearchaeota archaeon]|nr:hypothetical protein [Candidatus Woesearchaeota archaeon]